MSNARAVSFDFGQTLATIDLRLLQQKLSKLHPTVPDLAALERGVAAGWAAYDKAVRSGMSGHPWKILMGELLAVAGIGDSSRRQDLVDALWDDQPQCNLWRKPIHEMIDLCTELARRVPIGVTSNSEGRLAELIAEMGLAHLFGRVADSGRLGFEKPDPRIFFHMAELLGVDPQQVVHIGDMFGADVQGALGAGMFAIWFGGDRSASVGERARVCHDAQEVRVALVEFGVEWGIA